MPPLADAGEVAHRLSETQASVLTEQMMAVFVLGAFVTTLMTGPLFDRFAPREPIEPALR